jgi:hypothetical protein
MIKTAPKLRSAKGWSLACVLALGSALAHAQGEAAVTKRATELRATPGDNGRSVASLPAQAPITRLGDRQGAWVLVRNAAGATGWLHLFEIGPASGAAAADGAGQGNAATGALRGLSNLFTKNKSTAVNTPTATLGIRALDAADLANAQPNPGAVTAMEGLRQNENQARAFAKSASLSAVAVEPLPQPQAQARRGGSTPPGPASTEVQAP